MKETAFSPKERGNVTHAASLSERERQVVELIKKAYPDKWIADELHISLNTVNAHKRSIFQKLQIQSRCQIFLL